VAQRDERKDGAELEAVDELLKKFGHFNARSMARWKNFVTVDLESNPKRVLTNRVRCARCCVWEVRRQFPGLARRKFVFGGCPATKVRACRSRKSRALP